MLRQKGRGGGKASLSALPLGSSDGTEVRKTVRKGLGPAPVRFGLSQGSPREGVLTGRAKPGGVAAEGRVEGCQEGPAAPPGAGKRPRLLPGGSRGRRELRGG